MRPSQCLGGSVRVRLRLLQTAESDPSRFQCGLVGIQDGALRRLCDATRSVALTGSGTRHRTTGGQESSRSAFGWIVIQVGADALSRPGYCGEIERDAHCSAMPPAAPSLPPRIRNRVGRFLGLPRISPRGAVIGRGPRPDGFASGISLGYGLAVEAVSIS